jgi:hypothetical protein
MYFESEEHRYHVLLKLSLVALYILLAYNGVMIGLGYYFFQSGMVQATSSRIIKNIIFIVAIIEMILIFGIKKAMLKITIKTQTDSDNQNQTLPYHKLLTITVVIAAMCSSIATYGLVLIILGEKFEILMLFVAISLISYQFFRLRPKDFREKYDQGNIQ